MDNIIQRIADGATRVQQAATQLSDCIVRFETYLSNLPGKVKTQLLVKDKNLDFALEFDRDGSKWRLFVRHKDDSLKPLTESSLTIKMAAMGAFPDLLYVMEHTQETLIATINTTLAECDKFLSELRGPNGKS